MFPVKSFKPLSGVLSRFQFFGSQKSFLDFLHIGENDIPKTISSSSSVLKSCFLLVALVLSTYSNLFSQTYIISSPKYASDIIYNHTSCEPGAICAKYSTSMSLSGTLTFDRVLAPNLNRASANLVSFSINDGVNTFTNQDSYFRVNMLVSTNSQGALIDIETVIRQLQSKTSTTPNLGNYINEVWLLPTYMHVFNATLCTSDDASCNILYQFPTRTSSVDLLNKAKPSYKATNTDLAGILLTSVKTGETSSPPNFSSSILSYDATVPFGMSQITIKPTALLGVSSISINGVAVQSGSASGVFNLNQGVNTFTLSVTAQDGVTKKNYSLRLTRSNPSTDANLSALSINPNTLDQTFNAQTISYTGTVPFSQTTLKISATKTESNASITLNGLALASATLSNSLPLTVGQNVFQVVTTAEDGITKKTYTITIQRQNPSTNAILDFLSLTPESSLTPAFLPSINSYTVAVPFSTSKIKFIPTSQDPTATVTVKGITVARGIASTDINLGQGNNIIPVVVTAQDGNTKLSYTVTISRAIPSSDANLADLSVNGGAFVQTFSPSTTSYTQTVPYSTSSATFGLRTSDLNATVTVNGRSTTNSGVSAPIALNVGSNSIQIRVTAENTSTVKSTTVTLTRSNPATNPELSSLTLNTGSLTGPVIENNIYKYTSSNVLFAVSSVTVTPTATDGTKTQISVNGSNVVSGTASSPVSLIVGSNLIKIISTAESGAKREHWITINRLQPSGVNDLQNLTIASGTLSPTFSASQLEYTATVADNVSSLSILPVLLDATASIRINGVSSANNTSRLVNLSFGLNEIPIAVRAENGATKTYKLIITRSLSVNANLSGLSLSAGTLSPVFSSSTTSYTASVDFSVTTLTLSPQKSNEYASVTINNDPVASSKNINLSVGVNTITAMVRAQDGQTTKTYTLQITRQAASNVSTLASLSVSSGTVASFSSSTTTYNVSSISSTIKVTASPTNSFSTLEINGRITEKAAESSLIPLISGVAVSIPVVVTAQDGVTKTTYTLQVTFIPPACSPIETTITENGKTYKVLTFSTVGDCQWQAPAGVNKVDYLIVGAGGGTSGSTSGNSSWGNFIGGGGGGGGGVLSTKDYSITPSQTYNIKVGAGGAGGIKSDNFLSRKASNGAESQFGSLVAKGGGAGGSIAERGFAGSSGGGGGGKTLSLGGSGILGQGFSGGISSLSTDLLFPNKAAGGGGGGAGASGSAADGPKRAGNGGRGILSTINGSSVYYGGGGGGGSRDFQCAGGFLFLSRVDCDATQGQGGQGGGASGRQSGNGNNGTNGIGGGAGGVGGDGNGGRGGNGIVVVRYELSPCLPTETTIVGTKNADGTFTQNPNGKVYKVLTFNSLGTCDTWTPPQGVTEVDYLVVGGGGSGGTPGGSAGDNYWGTGGGGAGGFREGKMAISGQTPYVITVGSGGMAPAYNNSRTSTGLNGGDSQFGNIMSLGGGGGGAGVNVNSGKGNSGGSGGGSGGDNGLLFALGTLDQGNDGAVSRTSASGRTAGGGGGGAGAAGNRGGGSTGHVASPGGSGGSGKSSSITGTATTYAGGGGGGSRDTEGGVQTAGAGGSGGGGVGNGSDGTNGLGGGGGGRGADGTGGDGGTGVVILRYEVSTDANLTALSVAEGVIAPVFALNTTSYSLTLPNGTNSLTITPTTSHSDALISINGEGTDSGKPSRAFDVEVGDNTFSVVVTAPDGRTRKIYTLNVHRISNDANLIDLFTSEGGISPSFNSDIIRYNVPVSGSITSIKLGAKVKQANATLTINGTSVLSGQLSNVINLPNFGANSFPIVVTAEDGVTTKTYTVVVSRVSIVLTNLTSSTGQMQESFELSRKSYSQQVANAVSRLGLRPVALDPNAVIRVNGLSVMSGDLSNLFDLEVGTNTLTVDVVAVDGSLSDKYALTVTRGAPAVEARLQNLVLSSGVLGQTFDSATKTYTMSVPFAADSTLVTATALDPNATLSINGVPVQNGTASPAIRLAQGDNTVRVDVTAQNGLVQESYTVTITRGAPTSEDRLSSLSVANATLSPSFAENTFVYTSSVNFSVSSVSLTAIAKDVNASIRVNGELLKSSVSSEPISLVQGSNSIQVEVFGQDGSNTNSAYTITITRGAPSADANLSALTLSQGTLSSAFAANTLSYTSTVPFVVESSSISATPINSNATLSINGETVSSGQASSLLGLAAGTSTTFDILVTAENGTTTKTYSIAVTRTIATSDELLSGLTHTSGILAETFASTTYLYTSTVPFATTSTRITPVLRDAKAQVKVNGNVVVSGQASEPFELSEGLNEFKIQTLSEDKTKTKEYVFRITRSGPSTNTNLSALSFSGLNLIETFSSSTTAYTAAIAHTLASTSATATLADPNATLRINGLSVPSGQLSESIALTPGSNQLQIIVTAQDGVTQKTYNVTISKQFANPQLDVNSALLINEGTVKSISRANLLAIDQETSDLNNLTYVVTTLPQNGTLFIDQNQSNTFDTGENIVLNTSFTQAQLNDGKVMYLHDGSETISDSFAFTLTDPDGGSLTGSLQIQISPVNDIPVAQNVSLTGLPVVGNTLAFTYAYSDLESQAENGTVYKWYATSDLQKTNPQLIAGAQTNQFILTSAQANSYVYVEVTPKDGLDFGLPVTSNLIGKIADKPTVLTQAASLIKQDEATLNGIVPNENSSTLIKMGFVFSESASPVLGGANSIDLSVNIAVNQGFTIKVTQLQSDKTYYFRSYAENSIGLTYGEVKSFKTLKDMEAEKDSDGDGVPDRQELVDGTDPLNSLDSLDSDGDGISDYIENLQGTNPRQSGDAIKDTDGDGVSDYVEFLQGTNPNTAGDTLIDSDGDGVPDYQEIQEGTDPSNSADTKDSDSDGVPDFIEKQQGTNPNISTDAKDSDGDGVPDFIEKQQGTDPNISTDAKDSDGDGVPDFIEKQQGTDTNISTDAKDSDGDGVPDFIEKQQGTNPNSSTDAKDSDGDGVPDFIEKQQGTDPNISTDAKDSDGDGVPDFIEKQQGTDPNNSTDAKDSDGDGVPDFIEKQQGTDPNISTDAKDSDGDGVPDFIEKQQGTNPNISTDAKDSDGDGVPDFIEKQQGTDPNISTDAKDSDGDGVPDFIEKQQGTNPNSSTDAKDSDGDGVPDFIEKQQGTNPNSSTDAKDSDGDGVPDFIEKQQGTDPNISTDAKDSDGDGVPDFIEKQQGTDPNISTDAKDSDGDGVPDFIEKQQGTDPNISTDAKDSDGDGVPDFIEKQQGTNPNSSTDAKDSDGDGVPDFIEKQQGTDPNISTDAKDSDGDGVPDFIEKQQGTDPNNSTDAKDSDGDGVPDFIEKQQGTDPNISTDAKDSDGDGVPDFIEKQQGTNPNISTDAKDSDGDGVPDFIEKQQGTDPNISTDAKDSDGDGVPDFIEKQQGTDPAQSGDAKDTDGDGVPDFIEQQQGTDPTKPGDILKDSDGDGVPDFVEKQQGTDPAKAGDAKDTDGDGVPDFIEQQQGTDPTKPGDILKDSDGDGVPDFVEKQQGTDPAKAGDAKDTDGDGVPDFIEQQQGTDPTKPGDILKDSDGDGVPDFIEQQQGTDPTKPGDTLKDSDGDGVPDFVEKQQGTDPAKAGDAKDTDGDGVPDFIEQQQGTDPTKPGDTLKDSDGDGVPDFVEKQQGTDPTKPGDILKDSDGDGVPDFIEQQQGTDPTKPGDTLKDSDGDGVPDFVEKQQGTDPAKAGDAKDTDGDGVPDFIEQQQGTDPTKPGDTLKDSDGDGVPDFVEKQQGTDPAKAGDAKDTDGDGVPDFIEQQQGTDPTKPGDTLKDSDGDGVPDYIEQQQGTDPAKAGDAKDTDGDGIPDFIEQQQGTDPTKPGDTLKDSDGDGVPDFVEKQNGTDPTKAGDAKDTDGDGVPDFVEKQNGTDPTKAGDAKDTDGDGVPDYIEQQQGTDPAKAGDAKDTDGDGVPDYIEQLQGTDHTKPGDTLKDSDGDGVPDYIELQQGTNPIKADDAKDSDGDGLSDYYEAKNVSPSNITLSESAISENNVIGFTLAQLSSVDAGDIYAHKYTLVSGTGATNNASFEIVGKELKVKELFDFEKKSSYSVRIRTTDAGSLSYEKSFTITIKDVNEAPTKLSLSKQNIYEGNSIDDLVGLLSSTDEDAGDSHSYTLVSGTGSTDNAAFKIVNGQFRAAQSFKYATKNSYSVRIRTTDKGGLSTEQQFSVSISEKPAITGTGNETFPFTRTAASTNPSISLGYTSQLYVNGPDIVSYNWTTSTGLSVISISNPEAKPKVTTTYSVEVTNRFGSKTTVSITVTVREDYHVTPTNLMSPNGDGENDVWVIENLESYPNNKVSIFDRAGRLIYGKTNYNNDWNGQLNGYPLTEDTYYYIILLDGGKGEKKGFITIVK
jgi:gliding motility-associated-like protein